MRNLTVPECFLRETERKGIMFPQTPPCYFCLYQKDNKVPSRKAGTQHNGPQSPHGCFGNGRKSSAGPGVKATLILLCEVTGSLFDDVANKEDESD
jgi:hypothetical protein